VTLGSVSALALLTLRDEHLGNYRAVSRIGDGVMTTVYRIEHTLPGRGAAIKVLQPELSQNQAA
jgi:serine/threonine protein kinase